MAAPKLKYVPGNSASTTYSSGVNDTDTAHPLTSDTNFAAKSGEGQVIMDEGTANEEYAYATGKSGASLTIPVANRGLEGTSAHGHTSGATIKGVLTALVWNDMIDVLKEVFDAVTGKFLQLKDANGNEILKHVATANAVNEVTITNAATNTPVKIGATGDDTNVDLSLVGKGTGTVKKPTSVCIQLFSGTASWYTGDGIYYFTVPEELNGMNLVGVHLRAITAGTTGTSDVQIANVTDGVDMLSTKLTIDSGETGSDTAATPAVIDGAKDDVATNDLLRIDIDAISTTAPKGAVLRLRFAMP